MQGCRVNSEKNEYPIITIAIQYTIESSTFESCEFVNNKIFCPHNFCFLLVLQNIIKYDLGFLESLTFDKL